MLLTSVRSCSYEETLTKIKPYLAKAQITRIADITGLDIYDIPVYTSFRPMSKSLSTSQGKGVIKEAAMCGAYMESLEVYFAEEVKPELEKISYIELSKKALAINPNDLGVVKYPDGYLHSWVMGKTIDGQDVWLPFQYICMDSTNPEVIFASNNTTGLASGNNLDEAIVHGVFEFVERCPSNSALIEVNFSAVNDLLTKVGKQADYYIGYSRNKYQVPVFECVIQAKNLFANRGAYLGAGCHLDRDIALYRAVTEAVQSSSTVIAGSRDDIYKHDYIYRDSYKRQFDGSIDFTAIATHANSSLLEYRDLVFKRIFEQNETIVYYPLLNEALAVVKSFVISKGLLTNG